MFFTSISQTCQRMFGSAADLCESPLKFLCILHKDKKNIIKLVYF